MIWAREAALTLSSTQALPRQQQQAMAAAAAAPAAAGDGGQEQDARDAAQAVERAWLQRLQRQLEDWAALRLAAAAVGLATPRQLCSLLTLADVFAGVAAHVTQLPLAGDDGCAALAVFAARLVLATLARAPSLAASLCSSISAAAPAATAWQWFGAHIAASVDRGASAASLSAPGALHAGDIRWLLDVAAAAAHVRLLPGCQLPVVTAAPASPAAMRPVAAGVSFWHRWDRSSCAVLAAVPNTKRSKPLLLQDMQQLDGICQRAGYSLACTPLAVRERLASRLGAWLLPLTADDAAVPGSKQSLLQLLDQDKQQGFFVVDVGPWLPSAATSQGQLLPSAGHWNELAALIRRHTQTGMAAGDAAASSGGAPEPPPGPAGGARQAAHGVRVRLSLADLLGHATDAAALAEYLSFIDDISGAADVYGGAADGGLAAACVDVGPAASADSAATSIAAATIHLLARASSPEAGEPLGHSLARQVMASAAPLARVLGRLRPGGGDSTSGVQGSTSSSSASSSSTGAPSVCIWLEVCSVYAHRPHERLVLQQMLAQLRPGDAVLVASLDRLARCPDDAAAIIGSLRAKRVALLAAAVGRCAAATLVLLDAGGQPVSGQAVAAAQPPQLLPAVMRLLRTVNWATSAQHGAITAQHAYMNGLLRGQPDAATCGAVSQVLLQL
jgi:hypothetical protein